MPISNAPDAYLGSRAPTGRRTIWLTGASGFLGSYILPLLTPDKWRVALLLGKRSVSPPAGGWPLQADVEKPETISAAARGFPPNVILHAAAISTVSACRNNPVLAHTVNVEATRHLAEAARKAGAFFIYISTDMVFAGDAAPYSEADAPTPHSEYGRSKAAGETAVRESGAPHAIVRLPLMYGLPAGPGQNSSLAWMLSGLRGEQELPSLFHDEWRTIADVRYVAAALETLADKQTEGYFHLGGPERLSRVEIGRLIAEVWGLDAAIIREASIHDSEAPEPRPADLSLDSTRAIRELAYQHPPLGKTLKEWHQIEKPAKPASI